MKTLLKTLANFQKNPQNNMLSSTDGARARNRPDGESFSGLSLVFFGDIPHRAFSCCVSPRRGFLLYAVIFIMIFLSLLAVQFHQMARNEQQVASRFEQGETARQAAEAAIDEAYQWMYQETAHPDSAAGQWLIQRTGIAPAIPLTITKAFLADTLRNDFAPDIRAEASLIDFRNTDRFGTTFNWNSGGKDGHGTLEIKVRVAFRRKNVANQNPVASCVLIRHYDYAIVSMVSPRAGTGSRSCYSHCFPLDYVLFARTGFQEFQKFTNPAQNSPPIHLKVDAGQRGHIAFGDANQSPYSTSSETFFDSLNGRILDTNSPSLRPYNYWGLWFRKQLEPVQLRDFGLFDDAKGVITLRGITHIHTGFPLQLNPPPNKTAWQIKGQGILIADSFSLKSGIQKQTPGDLCILYTRNGNIEIDTDQPIEAVLIALGANKRTVLSRKPLNLTGAIIVDELQLADLSGNPRWSPGTHQLKYDPLLGRDDFLYQINISRLITFQRQMED